MAQRQVDCVLFGVALSGNTTTSLPFREHQNEFTAQLSNTEEEDTESSGCLTYYM